MSVRNFQNIAILINLDKEKAAASRMKIFESSRWLPQNYTTSGYDLSREKMQKNIQKFLS